MIEQGKILQQRYRVDGPIGQGGMGAVYIATDLRLGSTVAVKETLFQGESYQKAIEREARLLNSLKHPALPRVSDHFVEENGQFLVMEYIPGDDLVVMLERMGRPFSFALVLHWADQLLDALDYLHGQQMPVIHRDIKPHNLKITPQGNVMLLDFGLAKGNPTDASHQTAAKSVFGYSRSYASLEQIQGTGTDPRSDLYALAATLYHLGTGQPPADALSRAMRVLGRQPDPLVPAHTVRREIPAGFSALIAAAMDLDPESRPRSAAQLRGMLKSHEEFVHLAAAASAVGQYVTSGSIEVETRLRDSPTHPQSNVATEVLPANLSQMTSQRGVSIPADDAGETVVRSAVAERPKRSRGKLVAAAASAAVLFIVCSVAAGAIYLAPSGLFGSGNAPNVREGQADPGSGTVDPLESGGTEGKPPVSSAHDPSTLPVRPPEPPSPPQEPRAEDPVRADPAPEPDARPVARGPKSVEPPRAEPQPESRKKRPGVRVDSIEFDRLPGGFRGVKVTRERPDKKGSNDDDDDGGFKITKFPNIFKKIPSKLRQLGSDDPPKKRTKQD